MPSSRHAFGGRHELGQNFLVDPRVVARLAGLLPPGPVLELGAGDGALTRRLATRPAPVTAVELDPGRVANLRRALGSRVRVVHADMLRFRLDEPHHVVSNVPFGITTPALRRAARLPAAGAGGVQRRPPAPGRTARGAGRPAVAARAGPGHRGATA